MNVVMVSLMILIWMISLFLMIGLLRSDRSRAERLVGILLLFVPFFGPLLYKLVIDPPGIKPTFLQARGPRGDFADKWNMVRPVVEDAMKRKADLA